MWEGLHGQHIQIRADELETVTGYANYGYSVHLTRFSTEVDFSSCDVRFGSCVDGSHQRHRDVPKCSCYL